MPSVGQLKSLSILARPFLLRTIRIWRHPVQKEDIAVSYSDHLILRTIATRRKMQE